MVNATFDLWLLGDQFLSDLESEFLTLKQGCDLTADKLLLFISDFFNVKIFHKSSSAPLALTRVINSLITVVNGKSVRLPKYLVVILDKDLFQDIELSDLNEVKSTRNLLLSLVEWISRQINTIIRRKRADIFDKCPGALSGLSTKIIFVRMLRRVGTYNAPKLSKICEL